MDLSNSRTQQTTAQSTVKQGFLQRRTILQVRFCGL